MDLETPTIPESTSLKGDAKQAHDQCRVVYALALKMAEVAKAQAAILEQAKNPPIDPIGMITADAMEWLGSHMSNQDALDDKDDWMDPIFNAVHEHWPLIDINPEDETDTPFGCFQDRAGQWLLACFGEQIAADRAERNHRFLEEALELVQVCGCTAGEAHQLVEYVFGRPVGEPKQEAGAVMLTLAALCRANELDMNEAAETELARVWTKVEQIRAKQAAKPKGSPLPQAVSPKSYSADSADEHVGDEAQSLPIAYELVSTITGEVVRETVPGEALVLDSWEERECMVRQVRQCRRCGGRMHNGIAMGQTFSAGGPDFPGDTTGMTISPGGAGSIVNCLKCEDCGWSVSG